MGLQYNTDPKIGYRYILNENFKEESDSQQIEGITLSKSEWTVFPQKKNNLTKFVKTIENEKGILNYEQFHHITGQIYDSSKLNYEKLKSGKLPNYKLEILAVMDRSQLQQIADMMNVDSFHKRNDVLVRMILEKQKVLKEIIKNKTE